MCKSQASHDIIRSSLYALLSMCDKIYPRSDHVNTTKSEQSHKLHKLILIEQRSWFVMLQILTYFVPSLPSL